MNLRIMQPIMVICDKRGYIAAVRVLRLTVEIERAADAVVRSPYKLKQDMCYSDFYTLGIKRIVWKSVHDVSFIDLSKDATLRERLYKCGGVHGATDLPVQLATGEVKNTHLLAVIGSLYMGELMEVFGLVDYKGTMLTWDAACSCYPALEQKLYNLYNRDAEQDDCWINNPHLFGYFGYDDYWHDAKVYALDDVEAMQRYLATRQLMKSNVRDIIVDRQSNGCICYRQLRLPTDSVVVPEFCTVAYVGSGCETEKWKFVGHSNLHQVEINADYAPTAAVLPRLHTYKLNTLYSIDKVPLPEFMAANPCVNGCAVQIKIKQPFLEQERDYSQGIYDCDRFEIISGGQLFQHACVPGATNLRIEQTIKTEDLLLMVQEKRKKHYIRNQGLGICVIGLAIASSAVRNILIKMRDVAYAETVICIDTEQYISSTQTQAVINLEKGIKTPVYLSVASGITPIVQGTAIGTLHYQQHFKSKQQEQAHIYAHVKTLIYYMADGSENVDLYMHGGVEHIILVNTRYNNCTSFEKGPRIHVRKGERFKLRACANAEIVELSIRNCFVEAPSNCAYTACKYIAISKNNVYFITNVAEIRKSLIEDL